MLINFWKRAACVKQKASFLLKMMFPRSRVIDNAGDNVILVHKKDVPVLKICSQRIPTRG